MKFSCLQECELSRNKSFGEHTSETVVFVIANFIQMKHFPRHSGSQSYDCCHKNLRMAVGSRKLIIRLTTLLVLNKHFVVRRSRMYFEEISSNI